MTDKYIPASKLLALQRWDKYKNLDPRGEFINFADLRAVIEQHKQEVGGKAVIKIHPEGWEYGEEPAGEPYTGGDVAVLALKNTELSNRISVLEDLLSSAYNIANRNGVDTHWFRFAAQLHINGISPVTAKTFKILPSDPEYTTPQPTPEDDWQPIYTVPKDRLVDILIDGKTRWSDCYYDRICEEFRRVTETSELVSIKIKHITHWRVIPALPAINAAMSKEGTNE